jgi:hypothetical protein
MRKEQSELLMLTTQAVDEFLVLKTNEPDIHLLGKKQVDLYRKFITAFDELKEKDPVSGYLALIAINKILYGAGCVRVAMQELAEAADDEMVEEEKPRGIINKDYLCDLSITINQQKDVLDILKEL